jgi:PAS domain-containing protein
MINSSQTSSNEFLQKVFDTIPTMLLLVDEDVRIQFMNSAALDGLGLNPHSAKGRRTGDALRCLHAVEPEQGCGQAAACRGCAIRNAVDLALEGSTVHRKGTCLELVDGDRRMTLNLQVSAGLFPQEERDWVLLSLENVEELTHLRKIFPICRNCGNTRDDVAYHREVTAYLGRYPDSDFSQGLCPECAGNSQPKQG